MDLVDDKGHGRMNEDLRRLFLAEGCNPACHICGELIPVMASFALVPAWEVCDKEGIDHKVEIMVCWSCRERPVPHNQVMAAQQKLKNKLGKKHPEYTPPSRGAFVVDGRIVT